MKRLCLFAGYDKNNIIHDYVVYFIKELSIVSEVYYLADNPLSDEELSKIKPYIKEAYGYKHGKYDFGSWQELIYKIGWDKLAEYDELMLINDSSFGPLYSLVDFFDIIEKDKEWDMLGINQDYSMKTWYLGSYFLIFRKKAFLSSTFKEHLNAVNEQSNPIREYEIPFAYKLYNRESCVIKTFIDMHKSIFINWDEFIRKGSPLFKKKAFSFDVLPNKKDWKKVILENSQYNTNLIDKYYTKELVAEEIKNNSIRNPKVLKKKLSDIRKWFLQINLKKHRKVIRFFGVYIVNKINIAPSFIKEINKD